MPLLALYQIILDHEVRNVASPGSDTERDFEFGLPSGIGADNAVLQFTVHPSNQPENLAANIYINDKQVFRYGPTSEDIVRSFAVVLDGGIRSSPLSSGRNFMTVRRDNGTGTLGFSDVVLWVSAPAAAATRASKGVRSKTSAARKRKVKRKTKGR